MLDVPVQLAWYAARLLAARRREIRTRRGTRALSTWRQAVFALAWFRDRPDIARLGARLRDLAGHLGERGFALMSRPWRTLQRALVLVQFEHKPRVPWGTP